MIDRASPIPLYYQLKQILQDKLDSGEWFAGKQIPTEQELEEVFGLSRTTVRQALMDLVADGYLVRQRGRGTTVAEKKIAYDPHFALELNDYMQRQGVRLGWRLLEAEWAAADAGVAQALHLAAGERVFRVIRLRLADTEPLGYHIANLPEAFAPHVDRGALETGDSLDYIRDLPLLQGHKLRMERELDARLADAQDAAVLDVRDCLPMLHLERTVYAEDGTPIEFMRASFRGDRFKYRITT